MLVPLAILRPCKSRLRWLILVAILAACGVGIQPAHAAAPTFFAAGAFVEGTGSVNAAWPASHAINDLGLLIIQTNNQAVPATPTGWTVVLNSPQGIGTGGTGGSTRLTVFYRRATSTTEGVVATGDSGSVQAAMILVFRGVTTTGDPWNITAGGTTTPASTAVSIPGATTTVPDTMVVAIVAHARDANTNNTEVGTWANVGLTSFTDLTAADRTTNAGNGGGFAAAYGVKAAAGAYAATTAVLANSSLQAKLSIALKPPIMTLADGTDPAGASLAPGGAATMNDAFTFVTTDGSNQVTAVDVGLATGTAAGLRLVEITDDGGGMVYGSVTDPGSDTPAITLSTNTLTATNASTQYKIRVTPKTHANMPAPAGASYAVTAKINSWTSTYSQMGSDAAGTTVTIDNLSPADVTAASCTAGSGQNALAWTNPGDADFNSVIVLRNTAAVVATPVEGTSYAVSNTIGASTVVCSTASTSCTDTSLTVGTAYHYKIFARDSNLNWSSVGVVPTGSPCTPGPSSFNVVNTGASPTAGLISTRIAGQDIAVDIVALNASSTLATGFTGTVAVELVNDTGVACASLPLVKTLTSQTFTGGNAGRHPLSSGQFEAEAYRQLKFRITYTGTTPNVTSCSSDAFANRPLQFVNVLVRDATRTTAGTTNTLNSTSNPGTGIVHNAGRPFQIDATAQNGAGAPATTTNYTLAGGQPVAVLTQCGVAAVCPVTPGTLTPGTFSVASGVITTTTASYNDVGSFNLVLEDRTFTAVDSTDAGYPVPATHYISSTAVTVGRFVPDYFTLEAGSTITPRSDIGACSGSSFTYMSERMDLVFTLSAREFAGGAVTPSYSGATLGALVLNIAASYSLGAIDSVAPTPLTSRLDLSLIPGASGAWAAGSASITAPLALSRAATPDGPYTSVRIGIAPSDPDTVTLRTADLDLDADNNASPERRQVGPAVASRFGRLRMQNASGSEKIELAIPLQAQYWTGSGFVTNTADGCTSLSAANLSFSAYTGGAGGISAANMNAANVSLGGAFVLGVGNLKLIKPTTPVPTIPGSTTLTIDLAAEAKTYLQGDWGVPTYSANPSARAAFGVYGAQPRNFIFFREIY